MSIINPKLFNAPSMDEYLKTYAKITACKDRYVNGGHNPLYDETVGQEVAQSWIVSKEAGVNLHADSLGELVSQKDLDNRIRNKRALLRVMSKSIELSSDIIIKKTSCVIYADPDGVVLYLMYGRIKNEVFERLNLRPGIQWQENVVGTTCSILSNKHRTVAQLIGVEHYSSMLSDHITTSVPITDDDGEYLGTFTLVTIFGRSDNLLVIQPFMLGWTLALASSIENEYRLSCRNKLFTEIKTKSYADEKNASVIIVDADGSMRSATFHGVLLPKKEEFLKKAHYTTILGALESVDSVLLGTKKAEDANCSINIKGERVPCFVSISPLKENADSLDCFLINIVSHRESGSHNVRQDNISLGSIVLESPEMKRIKQKLYTLTQHKMRSLLVGESGTGKEMLALAIHNQSCRNNAFISFNCATIQKKFLETEIFGLEKAGSATTLGKLDYALGGTLYISEIADIPLGVQGILAKIIERGRFTRVGGDTFVEAPYNILIGTENDPVELLRKGVLREDFFSAISMPVISLPPLRERTEDIIPLAKYFISRFCSELSLPEMRLSGRAEKLLLTNNWPGNVRQLKLAVQYAIHSTNDGLIKFNDFPQTLKSERIALSEDIKPYVAEETVLPLAIVEKNEISKALFASQGNIKQCSQILGISRSTLYRKIKEYGLGSTKNSNKGNN